MASLRVALVQEASGLEPEANRASLDRLAPRDTDLIVFPEAFARDFGEAGSDVSAYAEPLDGPFATEVARVAEERGATVVAGMFEPGDEPGRPFNTLVARGAPSTRRTARSTSTTPSATASPTGSPPVRSSRSSSTSTASVSG